MDSHFTDSLKALCQGRLKDVALFITTKNYAICSVETLDFAGDVLDLINRQARRSRNLRNPRKAQASSSGGGQGDVEMSDPDPCEPEPHQDGQEQGNDDEDDDDDDPADLPEDLPIDPYAPGLDDIYEDDE